MLQISRWLLPRVCACCGFNSENYDLDLCTSCRSNLPWLEAACYQCAGKVLLNSESILCQKCQDNPPNFDRVCALFAYKPPIIKLIARLKFGGKLYAAELFASLLSEKITNNWYLNKSLPQVIIPVPLHEKRYRSRGYNQAAELARPIAKKLGIPLDLDLCSRIKHTSPQAKLNRSRRTRNLASAFALTHKPEYQHIALIDDVFTTGSTVSAVSKVLLGSGVDNIDVWCVARA